MADQWYYGRDGQHAGPVTSQQLKGLVDNGDLQPTDLVWKEGLSEWIPAKKVKGLFSNAERLDTKTGLLPSNSTKNTVAVSCGNCGARYKVDEAAVVGGRVKCRACANRILVGAELEESFGFPVPDQVVASRELTEEETQIARRRLSAFAQSIPHHAIDEFGTAINISETKLVPCYQIDLQTLYEQRVVEQREAPYEGEQLPTLEVDRQNIAPWEYDFVNRTEFKEFQDELRVDKSQSLHDCGDCGRTGAVPCPDCEGHGQVCCPGCAGSAAVACPQCRGRGVVRQERSIPVEKACWVCNGTGRPSEHIQDVFGSSSRCGQCRGLGKYTDFVSEYYETPCGYCGTTGQVQCGVCGATGAVTCETCNGKTRITCGRCDGRTQLVSFLTIVRTLSPSSSSKLAIDGEIEDPIHSLLRSQIDGESGMLIVGTAAAVGGSSGLEELTEAVGVPILAETIRQLTNNALANLSEQNRVAYQSLTIRQTVAAKIHYSFKVCEYDACLLGEDASPLPLRNPFTDLAESSLKEAISYWQQGEKQKAIENLNLSRAIATKDEMSKTILEEYQEQTPVGLRTAAAATSMMVSARAAMLRGATAVSETIDAVKNSKLGRWLGKLKENGDVQE
ncbi:GYF domain-containing protein [Bremerella sp. P1]|uniref:GYF domain-containing protein n=1 Tax=Bremerella sp. P1 TaxID=3026424 RepID=UPI0023683A20|nr:GYF domain-containing protein [Bremerella sp. P1]WDI43722.1 GYF domain-containing protein [Bremerella sp. P1]